MGVPYLDAFENSLFIDAGAVWSGEIPDFDQFVKSAGLSVSYSSFRMIKILTGLEEIKMDFPLWIGQNNNYNEGFGFRWLISFDFDMEQTPLF